MAQEMIQMTSEQFKQMMIDAVKAATAGAAAQNVVAKQKGSLANCCSRFGGQRDHQAVEEFITAVETYKDIESISDEDALKGVSLLFYGLASTWWQGVRKEAKTWQDAIALIRDHFSPTKPAYQVYVDIFELKQDDKEPIDTFVCNKRALLAQLPEGRHDEETEIDLVYGLLNIKYRQYIARHEVSSFRELLEKGRIIEHNNAETTTQEGHVRGAKRTKRCTYCNFRGHSSQECRKRKKEGGNASDADE